MHQILKNIFKQIFYQNDPELLNNPYKKSQDYFIAQNFFATAFLHFTGGIFLTGFAIYLGARDELVGYIAILPNICGIFLILGGFFLQRFSSKKRLALILIVITKTLFCSIVLIPLLASKEIQSAALFIVLIFAYTLQALTSIALNNWFISVVPEKIRGRYFAIRQSFALIVTIGLPLFIGRLLDLAGNKYLGFLILYGLGFVVMIMELYTCFQITEPFAVKTADEKYRFKEIFVLPVKNKEFMYYTSFLFVLYIILWLSCCFTQVYILKYLKLSYTFANSLGMFSAVLQIIFLQIWGKIGDRYGHQFVMDICIWFFAGEMFFWALLSKPYILVLMPIAYLFSAIANSGFLVSVFNRRYMIIPGNARTVYDGFYSAAIGVAFILGPSIGAMLKFSIASNFWIQKNIPFGEFRVLYLISCIGVIMLKLLELLGRVNSRKISISS